MVTQTIRHLRHYDTLRNDSWTIIDIHMCWVDNRMRVRCDKSTSAIFEDLQSVGMHVLGHS